MIDSTIKMNLPGHVLDVLKTLHAAGFDAYVVGGCVRDFLMGKTPSDYDVATAAAPNAVKGLFSRCADTGVAHGTVTVVMGKRHVEVTTFRIDGGYSDGRHPDSVTFTDDLTEDLRRRDFTINAVAYNENTGFKDPFGGLSDIQAGVIRGVGDPSARFQEDALRMMRALRFSAQLGFDIEKATYTALLQNASRIRNVSIERVRDEWVKILLSPRPQSLAALHKTGLLAYIHGETDRLFNEHAGKSLPLLSACRPVLSERLSVLFLRLSEKQLTATLKFFRFDNRTVKETITFVKWLQTPFRNDDYFVRQTLGALGLETFETVIGLKEIIGPPPSGIRERLANVLAGGDCCALSSLAVKGDDLKAAGITNGKAIGRTLAFLLDAVLKDPAQNDREVLLSLALSHNKQS